MIYTHQGVEIQVRDDVPVVIGLLMEKLGVTELEIPMSDLFNFEGELTTFYNHHTGNYTIHLAKKEKADGKHQVQGNSSQQEQQEGDRG